MANTKSAKKAIRSSARKKTYNDRNRRKYREARKNVVEAVEAGDKKKAESAISGAYKAIDKAAQKKTIHKKTAARYKSRIMNAFNKIEKK